MAASRRALASAALLAVGLAACDVLLGLNQYSNVACVSDCDAGDSSPPPTPDASEAGFDASPDARPDADGSVVVDAPTEVAQPETSIPEGGVPPPPGHETWAHWPMPNPDASIDPTDPDASLLPSQMAYDAAPDGADAGPVVYDTVTHLTWWRSSLPATSFDDAWIACNGLPGTAWRMPTRIELISLVDFTRQPITIDVGTFPDTHGQGNFYWTASAVAGAAGAYWTVSFANGLASGSTTGSFVRCVSGGTGGG